MRPIMTGVFAGLLLITPAAPAQPPGGGGRARIDDVDSFVARMMAFDKNKDGKLTRDEITDDRLLRLFDRADSKKVGVVTKDDLAALYARGESRRRSVRWRRRSGRPWRPRRSASAGPGPSGFPERSTESDRNTE